MSRHSYVVLGFVRRTHFTLYRIHYIITSYFVLRITSITTNTMTVNSPIIASVSWVMSCARNTISPSLFPVKSVAKNTTNGTLTRMEPHGNHSYERTSIPVLNQLPPTRNFYCFYEPKVMKSKARNLEKMHPNISLFAHLVRNVLSGVVQNL